MISSKRAAWAGLRLRNALILIAAAAIHGDPAMAQVPTDLTGGQFTTNCGNATAAKIFDAALINSAYGVNNIIAVSDPDIVLIGNQWWMIFATGPSSTRAIQPFAAYLPPGASLSTSTTYPSDPNGWHIVGANASGTGTAIPVSPNPGTGGWDQLAAETPSVDVGPDGTVSIYYSGHNAGQTPFQIGLMTNFANGFATGYPNPVLTAQQPWEFSSGLSALLEQSVRWMPQLNKFLMYYTAGAWWAIPPDNAIAYAESTDGINWVNRQKLDFPVSYYNQDFVYNPVRNRYEMVISNDPTGAGGANPRNIVWREAATPAVTMANWIDEVTLLQYNAANNAPWYNSGVLSPSVKYGNLPGETNRIYVFFHTYTQSGDMSIGRFYCDASGPFPTNLPQTITFNPIPAQDAGASINVYASASSNLPVTFSVVPNGNCSISGNTLTLLNAGNCGVLANQAGNSEFQAAPQVGQVVVVYHPTHPQTITFNPIPAQAVGSTLVVTATASSSLPVTFTVVPNGNCSISGNTVTFLNAGNCGVVANQAGNATYLAAPSVGQVVQVNNPTPQSIAFSAIPAQKVGTPLALSATATSGLAVSFASSTTSVCTVSGVTASFAAAGTCTIVASQPGNSTYSAAPSVSQSFTVSPGQQAQTITFNPIPAQTVGSTLVVGATASSNLPVTFSVVPNGNCSISGNTVTFLNVGNCGIVANQAGNATYLAAPAVGQIIQVNSPTPQSITFSAIPTQIVGTPLALSASATSGLAVSFASSTTGVCTISGTTASFVAAGTCTIAASQPGNGTYSAAASVSRSFTVTREAQTITFNPIPAQTVGHTLALSATASSGLPIGYVIVQNGNCSISGSTVTFLNPGVCGVVATQSGNGAYVAAAAVGQAITVN